MAYVYHYCAVVYSDGEPPRYEDDMVELPNQVVSSRDLDNLKEALFGTSTVSFMSFSHHIAMSTQPMSFGSVNRQDVVNAKAHAIAELGY